MSYNGGTAWDDIEADSGLILDFRANAQKLKMGSIEVAKESERGIIDIETLKQTNAQLIQTFDEVMKIQAEGRTKRLAAEAEMLKMENDLKQKLLQIRNGN